MGILSNKEYNNPETYRSLGFEQYIIRSAGGDLGRRTQTDQEATSPQPGHAEYFIDNYYEISADDINSKQGTL